MAKIRVTAQQRANALDALNNMWPSVPPENVMSNLGWWRNGSPTRAPTCNTIACFGGWCAWWPAFRAQGVRVSRNGKPFMRNKPLACEVSQELFGCGTLFFSRRALDEPFNGTDHQVVTQRLRQLIRNSIVVK